MVDINGTQHFANRFGAHHGLEVGTVLLHLFQIFIFGEQLTTRKIGHAGIDDAVSLEVQNALDITQRDIQNHTHARGKALEEPNMRHRAGQFNVAHAFTAHFGKGYFHAALFANDAAVLQTLVLTAQAFVVLNRSENFGAEQTIAFRLKGTIVNRFRLFYFAVGPRTDLFRRCKTNLDRVKVIVLIELLKQIDKRIHQFCP